MLDIDPFIVGIDSPRVPDVSDLPEDQAIGMISAFASHEVRPMFEIINDLEHCAACNGKGKDHMFWDSDGVEFEFIPVDEDFRL